MNVFKNIFMVCIKNLLFIVIYVVTKKVLFSDNYFIIYCI